MPLKGFYGMDTRPMLNEIELAIRSGAAIFVCGADCPDATRARPALTCQLCGGSRWTTTFMVEPSTPRSYIWTLCNRCLSPELRAQLILPHGQDSEEHIS